MLLHLHCNALALVMIAITVAPAVQAAPLEAAKRLRIFFAHQSVGRNVLDGLAELGSGQLQVVEGHSPLRAPALEHAAVGQNGDAASKLAHFERLLDEVGPGVDVALVKLCYVDITADTDVVALFAQYRQLHARLRAKFPQVTFVHVTVPLTTVQGGLTGWVKSAVGQGAGGERENAQREAFNELVRAEYATQPLFDLARLESTRADGTAQTFERRGARVRALAPEYSDDGGHLNARGRRLAALGLLEVLATLAPKEEGRDPSRSARPEPVEGAVAPGTPSSGTDGAAAPRKER